MNISRATLIIGLVLAVLVGLIVFGGTGWHVPPAQENSIATTNSDATESGVANPEGWKLYSNAEIGISFQYPASWGNITIRRDLGCQAKHYPQDQQRITQITKDRAENPQDPCEELSIGPPIKIEADGEGPPKTILMTMTPLYAKYPIPLGSNSVYRNELAANEEAVKNLCANQPPPECSTFTNEGGVFVAKRTEFLGGDDTPRTPIYYIHSPNTLYPGIVIFTSGPWFSSDGKSNGEKDIEKVVDTFRFIP